MPLYVASQLCRFYARGPQVIRAVDQVDLTIEQGEFLAIVGSSGSGKSTILNLLSCLDTATSGSIVFDGEPFSSWSRPQAAAYRAKHIGMVFQAFNLIQHRTALENVELALQFTTTPRDKRRSLSTEMLQRLGLGNRIEHRPADLSGGEQQRVALARALVKSPKVLFADEPTGSLDEENSTQIMQLLSDLNKSGITIIMVTHNLALASRHARTVITMRYGKIVDQYRQSSQTETESA
jgi:ABC-type lipoprotein export system ATPase subunit